VTPPPEEHVIDPILADTTPPGALEAPSYTVFRGNDREVREAGGCGQDDTRTSCEGVASLTFFVEPPAAADDDTGGDQDAEAEESDAGLSPEPIGYLIELIDGAAPEGLLPETPVVASQDGNITLFWHDGEADSQEMISFTVAISAVDAAGNAGEPSEVHVFDGASSAGCRTARGFAGSWAPSALFTLLLLAAAGRAFRRIADSGAHSGRGFGRPSRLPPSCGAPPSASAQRTPDRSQPKAQSTVTTTQPCSGGSV
jgi:hypothetical protein